MICENQPLPEMAFRLEGNGVWNYEDRGFAKADLIGLSRPGGLHGLSRRL